MSDDSQQERTRLCPACRMPISVLATKCRHCGEEVSRPKDEARKFTVEDLGGEEAGRFGPGEDAMLALEAYLEEEYGRTGPLGERTPGDEIEPKPDRVDAKDPERETRAGAAKKAAKGRPKPVPFLKRKPVLAICLFVGAGAVFWGGRELKSRLDAYVAQSRRVPESPSAKRAQELLDTPGSELEALEAARDALKESDTGEHRQLIEEVAERISVKALEMLDRDPWSPSDLDAASSLAAKALDILPENRTLREMKRTINDELFAYKMTIEPSALDADAGMVTLRINYPDRPSDLVIKKKDEIVSGRFKIEAIYRDYIALQDLERRNPQGQPRRLRLPVGGVVSRM